MNKVFMGVCFFLVSMVFIACGSSSSSSNTKDNISGGSPKDFRVVVTGEMPIFAKVSDMDVSSYGISADQMFLSDDGTKLYVFGGTDEFDFNKKLLEYDLTKGVPTKASRGYALATENREMKKLVSTSDGKIGFFIGEHNVDVIDLEKFQTMNILNLTNEKFGDSYYMDGILSEDKKYFYLVETNTKEDYSTIRKFDISELTKEKDQSFYIKEVSALVYKTRVKHIDISKDGNSLYMICDGEDDSKIDGYFSILDLSDEKSMKIVSSISTEEVYLNIARSKKDDDLVYLSSIGDDFTIWDVKDSTNPKKVSQFSPRSRCGNLSISKDGNILVCDTTVFDISDIYHPNILRKYVSTGSDDLEYSTQNLVSNTNKLNGYVYSKEKGELKHFTYSELYDKNYVSKIAKNSLEDHLELSFVSVKPKGDTVRYTVDIDNQDVIKLNGRVQSKYEGHVYFSDGVDIEEEETEIELIFNETGVVNFDVNVKRDGKTYKGKAALEVYDNDK